MFSNCLPLDAVGKEGVSSLFIVSERILADFLTFQKEMSISDPSQFCGTTIAWFQIFKSMCYRQDWLETECWVCVVKRDLKTFRCVQARPTSKKRGDLEGKIAKTMDHLEEESVVLFWFSTCSSLVAGLIERMGSKFNKTLSIQVTYCIQKTYNPSKEYYFQSHAVTESLIFWKHSFYAWSE